MKTNFKKHPISISLATIALVSCNNDDEMANATITSAEFTAITKDALTGKTQKLLQQQEAEPLLDISKRSINTINGNALTKKNGSPVTG
jgi:hypothetical protein